jgi:FkbM family methyltransferase
MQRKGNGNSMMTGLKRLVSGGIATIGRMGVLDACESLITLRVARVLLDPAVIGKVPALRPLRDLDVRVLCDPYNPFHRAPYWLGRLHERELEAFLRRVLRPGDWFLDIGSNYGHFAYLAAALVHPGGGVDAVEPHPELARMIEANCREQKIAPIRVHAVALSCQEGQTSLRVNPNHIGASTVRLKDDAEGFVEEYPVTLRRGDALFSLPDRPRWVVAKIDVEGHEMEALRGMGRLLKERIDALVVEVTPQWIGGAVGVERMFAEMDAMGFLPYLLRGRVARRVEPQRVTAAQVLEQTNILWARSEFLTGSGLGERGLA